MIHYPCLAVIVRLGIQMWHYGKEESLKENRRDQAIICAHRCPGGWGQGLKGRETSLLNACN